MVARRVWGTMFTSNSAPSTRLTVRLVPSMHTEPFSAMYRASASGARNSSRTERASSHRALTCPMPSTWPETRWPPRRVCGVNAVSRLTRLPVVSAPSVVRASDSDETSVRKPDGVTSMAVRHTPLTQMESPTSMSADVMDAVSTSSDTSPEGWSICSSIRPTVWTIPVNMVIGSSETSISLHSRPMPPRAGTRDTLIAMCRPHSARRFVARRRGPRIVSACPTRPGMITVQTRHGLGDAESRRCEGPRRRAPRQ